MKLSTHLSDLRANLEFLTAMTSTSLTLYLQQSPVSISMRLRRNYTHFVTLKCQLQPFCEHSNGWIKHTKALQKKPLSVDGKMGGDFMAMGLQSGNNFLVRIVEMRGSMEPSDKNCQNTKIIKISSTC